MIGDNQPPEFPWCGAYVRAQGQYDIDYMHDEAAELYQAGARGPGPPLPRRIFDAMFRVMEARDVARAQSVYL